jgi:hypothetical protein
LGARPVSSLLGPTRSRIRRLLVVRRPVESSSESAHDGGAPGDAGNFAFVCKWKRPGQWNAREKADRPGSGDYPPAPGRRRPHRDCGRGRPHSGWHPGGRPHWQAAGPGRQCACSGPSPRPPRPPAGWRSYPRGSRWPEIFTGTQHRRLAVTLVTVSILTLSLNFKSKSGEPKLKQF